MRAPDAVSRRPRARRRTRAARGAGARPGRRRSRRAGTRATSAVPNGAATASGPHDEVGLGREQLERQARAGELAQREQRLDAGDAAAGDDDMRAGRARHGQAPADARAPLASRSRYGARNGRDHLARRPPQRLVGDGRGLSSPPPATAWRRYAEREPVSSSARSTGRNGRGGTPAPAAAAIDRIGRARLLGCDAALLDRQRRAVARAVDVRRRRGRGRTRRPAGSRRRPREARAAPAPPAAAAPRPVGSARTSSASSRAGVRSGCPPRALSRCLRRLLGSR